MISIQPDYIYFSKIDEIKRVQVTDKQLNNLNYNIKKVTNNELSEQIKSKIKKTFNWMLKKSNHKYVEIRNKSTPHKLSFITLTLPSKQNHSDVEIKKCLNQLITEFQKIHLLNNYIWKAELQENQNIHFHLITDSFIPWNVLRKKWNRIIEKLGYVSEFSKKMNKLNYPDYLKKYKLEDTEKRRKYFFQEKRTGFKNPNSVDVRNVVSNKKAEMYMLKYVNKNVTKENGDKCRKITGKRVGISEKLSQIRFLGSVIKSQKDKLFSYFFKFDNVKKITTDFGMIMYFKNIVDYADKIVNGEISQFFDEFLNYEPAIYDHDYYNYHFNQIIRKVD